MNEFRTEREFETALIDQLTQNYGWKSGVLANPTPQQLIDNWARILYENNKSRLNNAPLTNGEMSQILSLIEHLRTPMRLNEFVNGKSVQIKRDNPLDPLNLGKEVSLRIYDRDEIAAGKSRYQIARQPQYPAKTATAHDRRGDLTLLINGMPLIHLELKRSGISAKEACNQIELYSAEKVFTGLYSLVQIFVAVTPDETLYFANPGPDAPFNRAYRFHWADINNIPTNNWKTIAKDLLSIPMAHKMIGYYTVADRTDATLKVMRSYQIHAAEKISAAVSKMRAGEKNQRGGYIWHTTGSGKTLTSYKSAQLIANSGDADKVVFLTDRIELGTQSLAAYRNFADPSQTVEATENSRVLKTKLKTPDRGTLIVTSIQKMSRIKSDPEGMNNADIAAIAGKKIVFIIDEAHRSVFGKMLQTIRDTFPYAMLIGFTGTPIHDQNARKDSTTATIFGNELCRYSLADGINDKNVLGFDPYKVLTYKDADLRKQIALQKAHALTEQEALDDPKKSEIYYRITDPTQTPMVGKENDDGTYTPGIEDMIPLAQYTADAHTDAVTADIAQNFLRISRNRKYHTIFAASSIIEAIKYYRKFKAAMPDLNITCLFDPGNGSVDDLQSDTDTYPDQSEIEKRAAQEAVIKFKNDATAEIIADYNAKYNTRFTVAEHAAFKRDLSARLAHKDPHRTLTKDRQIDILIVVNQMLTGYDSKYVNALCLDKLMRYESIIQAFSRTNRICDNDKPFGIIRYYRKPHTMERNIAEAVKLYSGDKKFGLFVEKLDTNLIKLNAQYEEIKQLFENAGIENFAKLPDDKAERKQFVKLFNALNRTLQAALVQGFKWEKNEYAFASDPNAEQTADEQKEYTITVQITKSTYDTLLRRYKELAKRRGGDGPEELPYDVEPYITETQTDTIDADYMNSRFKKFLKSVRENAQIAQIEKELHRTFADLSPEQQKYANIILNDIKSGTLNPDDEKTITDLINDYARNELDAKIAAIVNAYALDERKLRDLLALYPDENNYNDFSRFDKLIETVDKTRARAYHADKGEKLSPPKLNIRIYNRLKTFIITHGEQDNP